MTSQFGPEPGWIDRNAWFSTWTLPFRSSSREILIDRGAVPFWTVEPCRSTASLDRHGSGNIAHNQLGNRKDKKRANHHRKALCLRHPLGDEDSTPSKISYEIPGWGIILCIGIKYSISVPASWSGHLETSSIPTVGTGQDGDISYSIEKTGTASFHGF